MIRPGASAPGRGSAPRRDPLVGPALKAGFLAWLPLALAGQLFAWIAFAVTRAYGPWSWVKIGLLNTIVIARVSVVGRADTSPTGSPTLFGPAEVILSLALGAGTIIAVVLLFRAGRSVARAGDHPVAADAIVAGAFVAVGFAIPMGLAALLVTLRFPSWGFDEVRPVLWQAFVFPLALGCAAGTAGALAAGEARLRGTLAGRRVVAALRGAWHTLVWALLLGFVGTLVLAAVRPNATTAYGRWLESLGSGGAVIAMYHAVLLPNQTVDVVAISMGECAAFEWSDGRSRICLTGVDVGDSLSAVFIETAEVPFGPGYLAFLLVPAVATVAGGRRAAEGARSFRERALRAAWAGVPFGALIGASAWAASIALTGDGEPFAAFGADPVETAALGLVWGVVGGALGSTLPDRAGVSPEPPLASQDPEGLPSETSLK